MILGMPWWGFVALCWWLGMIFAALFAGMMQTDRKADGEPPYPDSAIIIFVAFWPAVVALAPIVIMHLAGQAGRKRKAKADGKSKR